MARQFLTAVVEQASAQGWTSNEHFTVDGTLLEAWASLKSFRSREKKDTAPPDDPGNLLVENQQSESRNLKAIQLPILRSVQF